MARSIKLLSLAGLLAAPAFADNAPLIRAPDWLSYKWFASTDPKHQNDDYLLLKPGETRKIPLTEGNVERLWFTASEPERIVVALTLKDGKVVTLSKIRTLFHEKATAFYAPSPNDLTQRLPLTLTTGKNSFLTVTSNATNPEGSKFYYQVTIRPDHNITAKPPSGALQRDTKKIELAPGAEKTIELPGTAQIQSIRLTVQKPDDIKSLRLRAAWDGSDKNAIDAPLTALLSLFDGGQKVQSAAFDFDGKVANLKWSMPFDKGAKITFVNTGSAPLSFESVIGSVQLRTPSPYRFCAVYGAARPESKKLLKMLQVQGKGAFCGLNLAIAPSPGAARRTFAYLEGNEIITADGQKFEGTGTEDFFSSAWYFPKQPFTFPYHGMTFKSENPPAVAAYRLMVPDAVPFKQSLQFDFEHGRGNNADDMVYQWVAFWYQEPAARFEVPNTLQSADLASGSPGAPPDVSGGPSHLNIFLTALVTALIVGGGGGLLIKALRQRK